MATAGQTRATLDDLYNTPEKAELIGGRIIKYMATGGVSSVSTQSTHHLSSWGQR
jgi:hypothetical protein